MVNVCVNVCVCMLLHIIYPSSVELQHSSFLLIISSSQTTSETCEQQQTMQRWCAEISLPDSDVSACSCPEMSSTSDPCQQNWQTTRSSSVLWNSTHLAHDTQAEHNCLFVGCLTFQQHASVSQGRICTDNFTCCHTEIEAADPTFHLTQSQYTDTGPTSPSADPITPGAWQGSHWSANV